MLNGSRWMRGLAGMTAIGLFASIPLVGGNTVVPPKQYVKKVCGALSVFHMSTTGSVNTAAQNYKNAPSQDTAISLRQSLIDEYNGLDGALAYLVRQTVAAGVPDVAKEKQFAAAVVDHEKQLADAVLPLGAQILAIDVTSSSRFATTIQGVSKAGDVAAESSKQAAGKLAAVKSAPAALHPIVAYLTTTASVCASK